MIMIAWAALIIWPIVSIIFYRTFTLPMALCLTIFAGVLLLPNDVSWNLPLLPVLTKWSIYTLCAVFLTLIYAAQKTQTAEMLPGWLPRDLMTNVFLVMLFASFFATAATNSDPLTYGPKFIPGLTLYDGFSQSLAFMIVLSPILLGRKVLSSVDGQRVLLLVLALSGLIYTLPSLYEVRMSPHLHTTVYGFFNDAFFHYARDGGFKPVVFMDSGLELAIYTVFSLIAAACLFRASKEQSRLLWLFSVAWLLLALVLYKSLGALLIAMVLLPLVLFLNPRMQMLAAVCVAGVVLCYPTFRAAHIVPLDNILSVAQDISPSRAASLNTRFRNEEALLAKAEERPLFGWGTWGRNRVYTEKGHDVSLTDGGWVVQFGIGGWFRYIALFGLLTWPVIRFFLRYRNQADLMTAALTLILCAKLVDIIPNSGLSPAMWLIAGSLLGRMEMLAGQKNITTEQTATMGQTTRPNRGYARRFGTEKAARSAEGKLTRGEPARVSYTRARPGAGLRE